MDTRNSAHAAVPKLPKRGQSGATPPRPPRTTFQYSGVFFLSLKTRYPPSPPARTGSHADSAVTVVVFYSYIVSSSFFFVSRDVDVAGLVTVESREREPFSWAFFF